MRCYRKILHISYKYVIFMMITCICRKTAQILIADDGPVWGPRRAKRDDDEDGDGSCGAAAGAIQRLTLKEDEAYFSSYADFTIHAEMLQVLLQNINENDLEKLKK